MLYWFSPYYRHLRDEIGYLILHVYSCCRHSQRCWYVTVRFKYRCMKFDTHDKANVENCSLLLLMRRKKSRILSSFWCTNLASMSWKSTLYKIMVIYILLMCTNAAILVVTCCRSLHAFKHRPTQATYRLCVRLTSERMLWLAWELYVVLHTYGPNTTFITSQWII